MMLGNITRDKRARSRFDLIKFKLRQTRHYLKELLIISWGWRSLNDELLTVNWTFTTRSYCSSLSNISTPLNDAHNPSKSASFIWMLSAAAAQRCPCRRIIKLRTFCKCFEGNFVYRRKPKVNELTIFQHAFIFHEIFVLKICFPPSTSAATFSLTFQSLFTFFLFLKNMQITKRENSVCLHIPRADKLKNERTNDDDMRKGNVVKLTGTKFLNVIRFWFSIDSKSKISDFPSHHRARGFLTWMNFQQQIIEKRKKLNCKHRDGEKGKERNRNRTRTRNVLHKFFALKHWWKFSFYVSK